MQVQTPNLGTARRSRRSRKAPEHFASQHPGLQEPDIESIERLFKMQEDARKNGKEANICICGIKLPRMVRVCKFCGWELSSKGGEAARISPSTPLPKRKKRQLPGICKGQPSKMLKSLPSDTVSSLSYGCKKSGTSSVNSSKVGAGSPLAINPAIKIATPKPLSRRMKAWRLSQCRIRWHRKQSKLTIMEPNIPCEAPWCRRWFFKDSDMLLHKFVKHIRPPFGYADQVVRGKKSKTREQGSSNVKRFNPKSKPIPPKTLCAICSKPGGYTQVLRLHMCSLCQNPCHMKCAITETSGVQPARKIYTCRFCHDRISRESMREIEAKIPIWNIYSTEEKFNPKNAEIDYIDGFCVKSYCCSES